MLEVDEHSICHSILQYSLEVTPILQVDELEYRSEEWHLNVNFSLEVQRVYSFMYDMPTVVVILIMHQNVSY
jgi:hypothetical protein